MINNILIKNLLKEAIKILIELTMSYLVAAKRAITPKIQTQTIAIMKYLPNELLNHILWYSVGIKSCVTLSRVCKIWRSIILSLISRLAESNSFYDKILSVITIIELYRQNGLTIQSLGQDIVTMVKGGNYYGSFRVQSILSSNQYVEPWDGICYNIYPTSNDRDYCFGSIYIHRTTIVQINISAGYSIIDSNKRQLYGTVWADNSITIKIDILTNPGPYTITSNNTKRIKKALICTRILNYIVESLNIKTIKDLRDKIFNNKGSS